MEFSKQKKIKKAEIDTVLIETASSLNKQFQRIQDLSRQKQPVDEDEDGLFCRSLTKRLRRLPPRNKDLIRLQTEQLFYQAEVSTLQMEYPRDRGNNAFAYSSGVQLRNKEQPPFQTVSGNQNFHVHNTGSEHERTYQELWRQ